MINITSVDPNPFQVGDGYLYTIHIEGMGEPQKTFDVNLAKVGQHEAEQFTSAKGKTYWRLPKSKSFAKKSYGKSPEEQASIQRMNALTNAVAYCQPAADVDTTFLLAVADDFFAWLQNKPGMDKNVREQLVQRSTVDIEEAIVTANTPPPFDDSLPPIEVYGEPV